MRTLSRGMKQPRTKAQILRRNKLMATSLLFTMDATGSCNVNTSNNVGHLLSVIVLSNRRAGGMAE